MKLKVLQRNGAGGVFVTENGKRVKKLAGETFECTDEAKIEQYIESGRCRAAYEGAGETEAPPGFTLEVEQDGEGKSRGRKRAAD